MGSTINNSNNITCGKANIAAQFFPANTAQNKGFVGFATGFLVIFVHTNLMKPFLMNL